MSDYSSIPHLLTASQILAMPEYASGHALNPKALRYTKSLGDAVGLSRLGLHLVRVRPGKETTQFHLHYCEEEFIYILSGRGIAAIGDAEVEVNPGDFMGFTAPSLPHAMHNPFEDDLVYLMGGERREFDVCDYPRLNQRLVRIRGDRHIVDMNHFHPIQTMIDASE